MGALESLKGCPVWREFDAILAVPRPSKHEEKIRAHLLRWAEAHGFRAKTDGVGNVVIYVPATPGHEKARTVILQSHMDMVTENDPEVKINFVTDPIPAWIDGDWIRTRGTTLGADNGIGLAASLAVAADPAVMHGPLEILVTVDEETGLTGAQNVDASLISEGLLLNLDSEEDGVFTVGCAGGATLEASFPLSRAAAPEPGFLWFDVAVEGLRGGHSGVNIIDNFGNALKLLARALRQVGKEAPFFLASLSGGTKHNAIPREACAKIGLAPDKAAGAEAVFRAAIEEFQREYGATEKSLRGGWSAGAAPQRCRSQLESRHLVATLLALPHGVIAMSREFAGIVETSCNLARVEVPEDAAMQVLMSFRSSVRESIDAALASAVAVAELAGGETRAGGRYPAWRPRKDSPLLTLAMDEWKKRFGTPAVSTVIHAGLECGILLDKKPGLEAISFGPNMHGVHSPAERLSISSTERFYGFLGQLLGALAR